MRQHFTDILLPIIEEVLLSHDGASTSNFADIGWSNRSHFQRVVEVGLAYHVNDRASPLTRQAVFRAKKGCSIPVARGLPKIEAERFVALLTARDIEAFLLDSSTKSRSLKEANHIIRTAKESIEDSQFMPSPPSTTVPSSISSRARTGPGAAAAAAAEARAAAATRRSQEQESSKSPTSQAAGRTLRAAALAAAEARAAAVSTTPVLGSTSMNAASRPEASALQDSTAKLGTERGR